MHTEPICIDPSPTSFQALSLAYYNRNKFASFEPQALQRLKRKRSIPARSPKLNNLDATAPPLKRSRIDVTTFTKKYFMGRDTVCQTISL